MKLELDDIASRVVSAFPRLSPAEQRISLALLYGLLTQGRPVRLEQLSASTGIPLESIRAATQRWPDIQHDGSGAVVGYKGLTIGETKHRFRVNGRQLYTWCAWDTLFLPPLLGVAAHVESTCPISSRPIAARISSGGIESVRPESAVLSFVIPGESSITQGVVGHFCCYVHFLFCAEDGRKYTARHADTFLLSPEEAWQVGIRTNAAQYPITTAA